MEIEKTRETSWRIHLKNESEVIEITSVEVSGEVRSIKLALKDDDNVVKVEMGMNEFFNFLSLISAFKDVIIGDDANFTQDEIISSESFSEDTKIINEKKEDYQPNYKKDFENEDSEELNPEEWDPW